MRGVDVIIPFGGPCEHRARALVYVSRRYESLGLNVIVGRCPGEWSKALAVRDALEHSTADVLVVADADCWSPGIPDALEAIEGEPCVMPHRAVIRLTQSATDDVYRGRPLAGHLPRVRTPYAGIPGGGLMVIHRDVYDQVPLDPRFVGWGGEDWSWGAALHSLAPGVRLKHPLYHLWHPPAPRQRKAVGSPENERLRRRYNAARRNPEQMRALVAEVTDGDSRESPPAGHPTAPQVA